MRSNQLSYPAKKKPPDVEATQRLYLSVVAGPGIEPGTSWLWVMRSNQLSYPAFLAIAGAKVSCFFELRNTFADFLQKIIFIGLYYKINAETQKRRDLLFFDLRSTILYQIVNCK